MREQKEIKELSEWLTNLVIANEAKEFPDAPDWVRADARVLVETCWGNDAYLSALIDDKKNRCMRLDFIKYKSIRSLMSDGSVWPESISVKKFLEWQQNIPEIKERWNTLQDLIDEIKKYAKSIL